MYFQTVLMNSPLRETVTNLNLWFIDWPDNSGHPRILTSSDVRTLKVSNRLFARKFDVHVDSHVFDLIDREMLEWPSGPAPGELDVGNPVPIVSGETSL
jgi:hypothetical protein